LRQTIILSEILQTYEEDQMLERVRNADDLEALESRIEETPRSNLFVTPLGERKILDMACDGKPRLFQRKLPE